MEVIGLLEEFIYFSNHYLACPKRVMQLVDYGC